MLTIVSVFRIPNHRNIYIYLYIPVIRIYIYTYIYIALKTGHYVHAFSKTLLLFLLLGFFVGFNTHPIENLVEHDYCRAVTLYWNEQESIYYIHTSTAEQVTHTHTFQISPAWNSENRLGAGRSLLINDFLHFVLYLS